MTRRLRVVLAWLPVLALAACPWADGASPFDGVPPAGVVVAPITAPR